ncbi:MAG TPA: DUF58 domain-containing protein [Solirubrobacteraceae bacterium]|nr:DUF58 domain-containing protein [Solirubrobacteraceae bacterium]
MALIVAAGALASVALLAAAIGLVLLAAGSGVAVGFAARRITVTRAISAREVQEDRPIHLRLRVAGIKWLPVRLEIEAEAGQWEPITRSEVVLTVCVGRPGAVWLAPSRLRLRDAAGIFEWHLHAGRAEPLLILPVPDASAQPDPSRSIPADDLEPQGLAPYTPGTPLARVHWPALARGAGLHVRQFAPPPGGLPLVVVDTVGAPSSQAVDWAARTAAGYIRALARGRGCRVLLPGDAGETGVAVLAGEWRAMHRRLAMLRDSVPGAPRVRVPLAPTGVLHVRAASAPAGLAPPPPLPRGVVPRSPPPADHGRRIARRHDEA